MEFTLNGHTALVTGATKGIGRATVDAFLRLGAEVVAVARTEADLVLAKAEWKQLGRVHICAADVATVAGREAVRDYCGQTTGGGISTLVNNVGTNIRKELDSYPLEDLRRLMAINVESAFELSKMLKPQLQHANNASIINVSSVAALNVVGTSTVAYAMSKGALDNLTRWLAVEWGRDGIRVNGVHPWYTRTELTAPLLAREELLQAIKQATPLSRCAEAAEVANAIAFLAMPAASYITGIQLPVDGGYLIQGIVHI